MKDEALKLALEALENSVDLVRQDAYNAEQLYGKYPSRQARVQGLKVLADDHEKAITAIRARLEQPEQEYERGFIDGMQKQMQSSVDKAVNAMSQRQWVGLTDEEISQFDVDPIEAKQLIAKLKEKNT
jgi:hypothetical protein